MGSREKSAQQVRAHPGQRFEKKSQLLGSPGGSGGTSGGSRPYTGARRDGPTDGHQCRLRGRLGWRWTGCIYFASRGSGVRVPLAPPGVSFVGSVQSWAVTTISDHNGSVTGSKQIVETCQGLSTRFLVDMRVDLHRRGELRVAQDHLSIPGRDMKLLQQRGRCVPQMVHRDHADLVIVADPPEGADKVPGLDRQTAASSEDQARVLPGSAEDRTAAVVLLVAYLAM